MYIAFEGIDYSGKTRLMNRLALHLTSRGVDYLSVREPGGFTNLLREHALNGCDSEYERAIVMTADRILTHSKVIKPYITRSKDKEHLILSDRCYLSTLVYQGAMSGFHELLDLIDMHDRLFADHVLVAPDVVFIIKPNVDDVIERMVNNPKGGKLDDTETVDRDDLVLRDEAYSNFTEGGEYDDFIESISPKYVEIFETDLDKQLAIVMEHIDL